MPLPHVPLAADAAGAHPVGEHSCALAQPTDIPPGAEAGTWSAALAPEAKLIVVGVAEAELANTPRLVLHGLAHQTDRFARIPSTAHLGLHCGPDGAWNRQQTACLPLLVQLVHLRRLDINLGVVPERLELRAGAQMNAQ